MGNCLRRVFSSMAKKQIEVIRKEATELVQDVIDGKSLADSLKEAIEDVERGTLQNLRSEIDECNTTKIETTE